MYVRGHCRNYETESTYVRHDRVHHTLRFDDVKDIPPASPGGSKVTYAVERTERETAWERGFRNFAWHQMKSRVTHV